MKQETQHTEDGGPEHHKGRLVYSSGYLYREAGGEPICQFWDKYEADYNNAESNALHIAACWNALAGMNPEALGALVDAVQFVLKYDGHKLGSIGESSLRTALALLTARKGTN